MAVIGAAVGIIVGGLGNLFITGSGIIALYFVPLATTTTLTDIIIIHGLIAFFEEAYVIFYMKIASNNLSTRGIRGERNLILGLMIGRGFLPGEKLGNG